MSRSLDCILIYTIGLTLFERSHSGDLLPPSDNLLLSFFFKAINTEVEVFEWHNNQAAKCNFRSVLEMGLFQRELINVSYANKEFHNLSPNRISSGIVIDVFVLYISLWIKISLLGMPYINNGHLVAQELVVDPKPLFVIPTAWLYSQYQQCCWWYWAPMFSCCFHVWSNWEKK